MMALYYTGIYVCCLDVVMSSLCISNITHYYLFSLQKAASLALSMFKDMLFCTCDLVCMYTVKLLCSCLICT